MTELKTILPDELEIWGEKQGDSVWCSLSRFKLILIFEYC